MNIQYASLHQIDHHKDDIVEKDISVHGEDLDDYINRLLVEISKNTNKRLFEFQNETTEVRAALKYFMEGKYEAAPKIIGNRLLRIEKDTQLAIAHLPTEIQKGSLFQASVQDGDIRKIIISKADHNDYLDTDDFARHQGLPWEKHVYKAALITFSDNNEILDVSVYDTNTRISKYWWSDFLELQEIFTDSYNTKKSLNLLERKIFNPIKRDFPRDHTVLRNHAIGYFRTKPEFSLNDFVKTIFTDYEAVDPNLPLQGLIEKVSELPNKWNFDSRFGISKEDINKRAVNKIPLSTNIDLVIKDYVPNITDIIKPEKDNEGNKFLKIRTDEGFDRFSVSE